ncbi:MAG: hypothetical protein DRJ63_10015 [Thermoprotei archaeon]|nr:MAG: hypothetical protein DRJ63_10015 [Thermoprotei archaeon]
MLKVRRIKLLTIATAGFIILLTVLTQQASAQELPPDLVAKLHTNLRVAILYDGKHGWRSPWMPIKYYHITKIDTAGLYGIGAYDVLVMEEYYDDGCLTTEQIDMIVEFVKGGGGIIILEGFRGLGEPLRTLLSKLGIRIKAISSIKIREVLSKDGKAMVDHPITVGVEKIRVWAGNPVVAVEIDNGDIFIKAPFVAVAKSYGSGRVILIGAHEIHEELSGLRFAVNCIEWAAGYTPPGWEPVVPSLRNETATLREKLRGYDELMQKYSSLKREYERLKAEVDNLRSSYEKLKSQYQRLSKEYNLLKEDYNRLNSEYNTLKSKYEEMKGKAITHVIAIPAEFTYLLAILTIILLITTIYYRRKSLKPIAKA